MTFRAWLKSRLGGGLSPEQLAQRDRDAVFQTKVMGYAIVLLGVMAGVLLTNGYVSKQSLPREFTLAGISVAAIGILTVGITEFGGVWRQLGGDSGDHEEDAPEAFAKWLVRRPYVQPILVYVQAALMVFAFAALVWGLASASRAPLFPLVTAPAVFGAFVATRGRTVIILLATVSMALGLITLQDNDPCDRCRDYSFIDQPIDKVPPVQLPAIQARLAANEARKPQDVTFLAVALSLMVIGGLLSARRLRNEAKYKAQIADLKKRLRAFEAPHEDELPLDHDQKCFLVSSALSSADNTSADRSTRQAREQRCDGRQSKPPVRCHWEYPATGAYERAAVGR